MNFKFKSMIKLKKSNKYENGEKIGEIYSAVVITDINGNATIYDSSEIDWREIVDCSTLAINEIEVPIFTDMIKDEVDCSTLAINEIEVPIFTDMIKDEVVYEKEEFIAPTIRLSEPLEFYSGIDNFYKILLNKNDKTELDKLNLFLLQLGGKDKIGYRRKLVIIRNYLKSIGCDWG